MTTPSDHSLGDRDQRSVAVRTAEVVSAVVAARGECSACGAQTCGHAIVANLALGHRTELCLSCLATLDGRPPDLLVDEISRYVAMRPCLSTGLALATLRERDTEQGATSCPFPLDPRATPALPDVSREAEDPARPEPLPAEDNAPVLRFDAGEMGCGELLLLLKIRFQSMPPRSLMELRATDPGAPLDIPAWCRLTGHRLLRSEPPQFLIQRKD